MAGDACRPRKSGTPEGPGAPRFDGHSSVRFASSRTIFASCRPRRTISNRAVGGSLLDEAGDGWIGVTTRHPRRRAKFETSRVPVISRDSARTLEHRHAVAVISAKHSGVLSNPHGRPASATRIVLASRRPVSGFPHGHSMDENAKATAGVKLSFRAPISANAAALRSPVPFAAGKHPFTSTSPTTALAVELQATSSMTRIARWSPNTFPPGLFLAVPHCIAASRVEARGRAVSPSASHRASRSFTCRSNRTPTRLLARGAQPSPEETRG